MKPRIPAPTCSFFCLIPGGRSACPAKLFDSSQAELTSGLVLNHDTNPTFRCLMAKRRAANRGKPNVWVGPTHTNEGRPGANDAGKKASAVGFLKSAERGDAPKGRANGYMIGCPCMSTHLAPERWMLGLQSQGDAGRLSFWLGVRRMNRTGFWNH